MWENENLKLGDKTYNWTAVILKNHTVNCIGNSRIRKLIVSDDDRILCHFDRQWVIPVTDEDVKTLVSILCFRYRKRSNKLSNNTQSIS